MKLSEIEALERMGRFDVTEWCYDGRPAEVMCWLNEATHVAYQVHVAAGVYRHTDPGQGQIKKYGDWIRLTPE